MTSNCLVRRTLVGLAVVLLVAGCSGGASSSAAVPSGGASVQATPPSTPLAKSPDPTPRPTASQKRARAEWPFEWTFCEDAPGGARLAVALGTSETAGWYLKPERAYSPEAAYPGLYADILCKELGRPVELHSYFPSPNGNALAPLAWWIEEVSDDEDIRADLSEADVVVLWAMSSHDVVKALFLPGACGGPWPDPLKACLEEATGDIPGETDELFGLIADLVRDEATVLAGDSFAPPIAISMNGDKAYRDEIKAMVDPYFSVKPLAEKHGFTFVDTEVVFNGPTRWEMPAEGLFQSDGLHLTAAGQRLAADTYAEQDGLGD